MCIRDRAPIYDTTNVAIDHNLLTMEMMKKVASKHGLVCLQHEKPFEGVNGSGKHNNWSISTREENLLEDVYKRQEYLRLLRAARAQGQRQLYLLVKLFALTGLPLQCLGQVTAAVVRAGGGELSCRGQPFTLCLPDSLQRELLAYMEEQRTGSGPLFVSRSGRVVNRSHLCRSIQELCRTAGVPEEKGSPRCLRALWRSTQDLSLIHIYSSAADSSAPDSSTAAEEPAESDPGETISSEDGYGEGRIGDTM